MNTRRLEALLAIVRSGSFAAASEQLNMTQSAISLRIRELEQELGITIFDRSRRRAELTAEGRSLIPHATAVIAAVNNLKFALESESLVTGIVRLGVTELIAVTWLPKLVNELQTRFPRVQLELEVRIASEVTNKTARGELDIALTPGMNFSADLETLSLGAIDFQWMASRSVLESGWSWDQPTSASPPVLLLNEHSFINNIADAWFRQNNISPWRIDTCNSMNVLAALTAAGLGVSLLPTFCYADQLAAGTLQLLDSKVRIPGIFYAVLHRNSLTFTARTVASICREVSTFPQHSSGAGAIPDFSSDK